MGKGENKDAGLVGLEGWSRESKAVINDAWTSGSCFALLKTDSVSRFSTSKHATSELFCAKSSATPPPIEPIPIIPSSSTLLSILLPVV